MKLCEFLNVKPGQNFAIPSIDGVFCINSDDSISVTNGRYVTSAMFKRIIEKRSSIIPAPAFTEDEISIMRKLRDIGYKFIGRDDDDSLWAFLTKPDAVHDEYHGVFERFETEEYDNMWQLPPKLIPCAPGYLIDAADHI